MRDGLDAHLDHGVTRPPAHGLALDDVCSGGGHPDVGGLGGEHGARHHRAGGVPGAEEDDVRLVRRHSWSDAKDGPSKRSTVANSSTGLRVSRTGWRTGLPRAMTAATTSASGTPRSSFTSGSRRMGMVVITPPSPSSRAARSRFHTKG